MFSKSLSYFAMPVVLSSLVSGLFGYWLGIRAGQERTILPSEASEPAEMRRADPPKSLERAVAQAAAANTNSTSVEQVAARVRAAYSSSTKTGIKAAAIAAALVGVAPDQVPELCELLRGAMNSEHGYSIVYALMPLWADTDPTAALSFANSLATTTRRHSARSSVINRWMQNDIEAALAHLQTLPKGAIRSSLAAAIADELAEPDPQRAFVVLQREGITDSREMVEKVVAIFSNWGVIDPRSASAAALSLPSGKSRAAAITSLGRVWAKKDPEAAFGFLREIHDPAVARTTLFAVFGSMVETNPQAAARLALELKGTERENAVGIVAKGWADREPNSVFAWLRDLPGSTARDAAMSSLGERWAKSNPLAAAAFAETLAIGAERDRFVGNVATQWGRANPEAALKWLRELPASSATTTASLLVLDGMVQSGQPDAAAKLLAEQPSSLIFHPLYTEIAERWADKDPVAAREWAVALPESRGRREALREIVTASMRDAPTSTAKFVERFSGDTAKVLIETVASEWVKHDPAATMDWINTLPSGANKETAIASMAGRWSREDLDAAIDWVKGLENRDMRDNAISGMISGLAMTSVESAASLVSNLPPGSEQEKHAAKVVGSWAASDPESAAAWVTQFPEGEARAKGMANLVSVWTETDMVASSRFLEQLPDSASRNRAIEAFVRATDSSHPELAASWVSQLPPGAGTTYKIERVAANWLRSDPAAAKAWLSRTPLPPERKAYLLRQAGSP